MKLVTIEVQSPANSSFFGQNIPLSTRFSHLSYVITSQWETKFHIR